MLLPPRKPHFTAALRDVRASAPRARALAAAALADPPEEREDDAVEGLLVLADDPHASVRGAALASLGRLGDPRALDVVLARFDDGDPMVRQLALIAAADIGDDRATAPLTRALRHERADVRFQALASLAVLVPEQAAERLGPLVEDEDVEVRTHLADVLGSLERPETAGPLGRLLEDPAVFVRRAAAIALARIHDDRGADALIEALGDKERVFEAAWALGELQVQAAREPLARVASSFFKPLATKAAAGAALVRLGDPRGTRALRAVLRAFRSDARSYAVELVGELRLAELADSVAALVDRPRGADLVVVARALAKLADVSQTARATLLRLAERNDEVGRAARAPAGSE